MHLLMFQPASNPTSALSARPSFGIRQEGSLTSAIFAQAAFDHAFPVIVSDSRPFDSGEQPDFGGVAETFFEIHNLRQHVHLLRGENFVARVSLTGAGAELEVAASTEKRAREALELLAGQLPALEVNQDETPVTFWAGMQLGGAPHHRRIATRRWSEARQGYAAPVQDSLEELMGLAPPVTGGRLLLWHGEPGTGKTYALRALAHAWLDWCAVHVVSDPDRLLSGEMAYLTEVMNAGDFERGRRREWRLIVLEDAGELLALDARSSAGQGLSRLLNASDGLMAQGTNALFLISTNEPLGAMHPAVHRPGRCLMEIEFTALSTTEANDWLHREGSEHRVSAPTPLAELFAIRDGRQAPAPRKQPVGFVAA